MERHEFGAWARKLDEEQFWRAVAMLGFLGAYKAPVPRGPAEAEKILANIPCAPQKLYKAEKRGFRRAKSSQIVHWRWQRFGCHD